MTSVVIHGRSAPLGPTIVGTGTNFSLYSRHATGVELLLFDREDDEKPSRTLTFYPVVNRSGHYWHMFVHGIGSGQIYGYRVQGPNDPALGMRFDSRKLLLDPYGRSVLIPKNYCREDVRQNRSSYATAMKNVVVDFKSYDWEGDRPLLRPSARTIIYETHVRGFTQHPNSGVNEKKRGTYAGLVEKIPYLQSLGITAVELLPMFQFDPQDCPLGKVNYWGYSPISFFAPHRAYSSRQGALGPIDEFRDMVKALHRAGIEVILDVVYNHTCEGNEWGATSCYRGIDNRTYYMLENGGSRYANYSGCGNTLNANHPVVRRLIMDSLRYWVQHMHVDGFRFDLASILSRDASGQPLPNPPVLGDVDLDPVLAGTKLIAEAWDAAGLYQVGNFIGDAWKEWNGRFRDDVRDFLRGADGTVSRFADRLVGSPAIYGHEDREAEQSINFVTCHDGFTLNDLVSYNAKHNEANGEENRDGTDDNRSWNCGFEGPSEDPAVETLRRRQVKNFLTVTLLSLGIPMICMGDEVRRSQRGNNNAYCQDNEISWFDWSLLEKHADILRFFQILCTNRGMRSIENEYQRISVNTLLRNASSAWHGVNLLEPDWSNDSHSLALGGTFGKEQQQQFHFIINAYSKPLTFQLPPLTNSRWRRWIDTSLESPEDIVLWEDASEHTGNNYNVADRSVVILIAGQADSPKS